MWLQMSWLCRGDWEDSIGASRLKIRPLLTKLQDKLDVSNVKCKLSIKMVQIYLNASQCPWMNWRPSVLGCFLVVLSLPPALYHAGVQWHISNGYIQGPDVSKTQCPWMHPRQSVLGCTQGQFAKDASEDTGPWMHFALDVSRDTWPWAHPRALGLGCMLLRHSVPC